MTAAVGHPTLRLIRAAIGGVELGDLRPGEWREIPRPRLAGERATGGGAPVAAGPPPAGLCGSGGGRRMKRGPPPGCCNGEANDTDARGERGDASREAFARGWAVIVWNDPVNLMSYVVLVFMKVLAFSKEQATRHMLEVHNRGKSCVAVETREKAELYYQQIQAHGLMATLEAVEA